MSWGRQKYTRLIVREAKEIARPCGVTVTLQFAASGGGHVFLILERGERRRKLTIGFGDRPESILKNTLKNVRATLADFQAKQR